MSNLTPKQLKDMQNKNYSFQLIDVRTPSEYASGYIKGSINIPLQTLQMEIENGAISHDKPVVVYCHSGARASTAEMILKDYEYKEVYNLGGILSWPYELEK